MKKDNICLVAVLALLWLPAELFLNNRTASAAEPAADATLFGFGRQSVGIAGGHGLALPVGGTSSDELRDLQFLYLAPRWGVGLSDPMGGTSWYRGNFDLVLEGSFLYSLEPKNGIAGGLTPLIRYNFLAGNRVIPFVQIGGGILALDFDLRRQADGVNFTPQAGLGFHYFLSEATALTGEWRYHHISNAGIHSNNAGINSSVVLFGITVFLR